MLNKATGIVLRRDKAKEADLSVQVLLESGKLVRLYLHGIRASRTRSQLLAEPGTLIRCDYYEKDEAGGSLKEGEILDRYEELKGDYLDTLALSYLLEAAGLAAKGEATPEVYQLLIGALGEIRAYTAEAKATAAAPDAASTTAEERRKFFLIQLLAFFKIRLLRILGLLGDSRHCDVCGTELGARAGWAVPEMTFRCARHADESSQAEAWMAGLITRAAATRFQTLRAGLGDPDLEPETWRRLDEWLSRCLEHYFATPSAVAPQLYRRL